MNRLVVEGVLEKSTNTLNYKYSRKNKIRIKSNDNSDLYIKGTLSILLILSIIAFFTFEYKNIDFFEAFIETINNFFEAFFLPKLTYNTFLEVIKQLIVTFSIGALATIIGGIIAFFLSLICAKNISNEKVSNLVKNIVAIFRAVPTILWVLIFAVSAGLGSVAAVVGISFHTISYLVKAYSESIEEMSYGIIEALKASGASYWQIVFQAILPTSISYMLAWTFLRFEINFANAVAMGAAAGAGGIGYSLFMSGSFYFDLRETGYLTIVIVLAVILLENISTKIKKRVK